MTDGEKVTQYLSKLLKGWDFSFVDALGWSWGLVTGCKTIIFLYLTLGILHQVGDLPPLSGNWERTHLSESLWPLL
jgi:hypothetical protein